MAAAQSAQQWSKVTIQSISSCPVKSVSPLLPVQHLQGRRAPMHPPLRAPQCSLASELSGVPRTPAPDPADTGQVLLARLHDVQALIGRLDAHIVLHCHRQQHACARNLKCRSAGALVLGSQPVDLLAAARQHILSSLSERDVAKHSRRGGCQISRDCGCNRDSMDGKVAHKVSPCDALLQPVQGGCIPDHVQGI